MDIIVNSKNQICDTTNLLKFLENMTIDLENVIIIFNEKIIKKIDLNEIILKENDKIEIINFVDGG